MTYTLTISFYEKDTGPSALPLVRCAFEGSSTTECETQMLAHAERDDWFRKAFIQERFKDIYWHSEFSKQDEDEEEDEDDD